MKKRNTYEPRTEKPYLPHEIGIVLADALMVYRKRLKDGAAWSSELEKVTWEFTDKIMDLVNNKEIER